MARAIIDRDQLYATIIAMFDPANSSGESYTLEEVGHAIQDAVDDHVVFVFKDLHEALELAVFNGYLKHQHISFATSRYTCAR